jgi:hypothetical protein
VPLCAVAHITGHWRSNGALAGARTNRTFAAMTALCTGTVVLTVVVIGTALHGKKRRVEAQAPVALLCNA